MLTVKGSGSPHLGPKYGLFKRGRDGDASVHSLPPKEQPLIPQALRLNHLQLR